MPRKKRYGPYATMDVARYAMEQIKSIPHNAGKEFKYVKGTAKAHTGLYFIQEA